MGNTPNNNFPFPESTDLVKDGAQAIEDLADAIDTTLGVYAPPATGLTLLQSLTFSAVSSQSINDVFSATYRNYLILTQFTGSTALDVNMRLRVAGADNSSTNYRRQTLSVSGAISGASRQTGETSWVGIISSRSVIRNPVPIQIFQPFETEHTAALSTRLDNINGDIDYRYVAHGVDVTTSYTGFTLITSTGTITGTVSVYGYNI